MVEAPPRALRILWLLSYSPWPANWGGKVRIYNMVRHLLEAGNEVHLWCVGEMPGWPEPVPAGLHRRSMPGLPPPPHPRRQWLLDPLPALAWQLRPAAAVAALADVQPAQFDVAVLDHAYLGGLVPELRRAGLPWVLYAHNVERVLALQEARLSPRLRRRVRLGWEAVKVGRLERRLARQADAVVVVSEADRERFQRGLHGAPVALHANGVDIDYFAWHDHSQPRGAELLFVGSLFYRPNVDACLWLAGEVMPAIRRRLPGARLSIVGADPGPEVARLHQPAAGISVLGPVEDVRPHLAAADLELIALRMGSGTRLKALEALAAGLPVVSTPLGVEGLGLERRGLALLGGSAEELAAQVVRGLTDLDLRARLSREGRREVESRFAWRVAAAGFLRTLRQAAGQSPGDRPD